MRHLMLAALVALASAGSASCEAIDFERLEWVWLDWIAETGASAATLVVASPTEVLHSATFGRELEDPANLASLGKPVLATCIATLTDEGSLRLDMPLSEVFGERLERLNLDASDNATITISELLTHRTGLSPDRTQKGGLRAFYGQSATEDRTVSARALSERRSRFRKGRHVYNNKNYQILGFVIAEVTGRAAVEVCRELTGIPSLDMSDYWGAFGSAAGWRASTLDYVRFLQARFTRNGQIGRQIAEGLPKARIGWNSWYGNGALVIPDGTGAALIEARGSLRNGSGERADGGFFLVWPDGPIVVATYSNVPDGRAQSRLMDAIREAVE